jgi:amidohydrolase
MMRMVSGRRGVVVGRKTMSTFPILKEELVSNADELTAWRHDFHANPELGFEEFRTSALIAERMESWGIEVTKGIAKTGVVGVLKGKSDKSGKSIGIRADMDCLPMREENDFEHKSTIEDRMHACGHDGHSTILLGTAKYLAETRNFDGTVNFIFQPAEECLGGGRVMVEEGLFERFPCDEVYGLHNWPELPYGKICVMPGPLMAAVRLYFSLSLSLSLSLFIHYRTTREQQRRRIHSQ